MVSNEIPKSIPQGLKPALVRCGFNAGDECPAYRNAPESPAPWNPQPTARMSFRRLKVKLLIEP